ncbi:unnamed protein product [Orchesella dallaii]|uniref:Uncharacterized protein n=1 Tax=Orchesella dallaii TaxID=48710 RepID=A0ABP1PXT4_9HEXA
MDQKEQEDVGGCATSTTEKTTICSSGRAIWTVKSINCDDDVNDLIASGVKCFVDLDDGNRLRFFLHKFDVATGDNDKELFRYLSLWVASVPRDDNGNQVKAVVPEMDEELALTVKVNRLTRSLEFDFIQLFETEVTIISQEDRDGVLVNNYFLNYLNEKINSVEFPLRSEDSMNFEIVVTRVQTETSPCDEIAAGSVSHGEALSSQFCKWDVVNPDGSENQFEMKLVAKDNVKLDAKNFLLAAHDHNSLRTKEEGTDSKSSEKSDDSVESTHDCLFSQKIFLRVILDWIYLGKMSESSGKLVDEVVNGFCDMDEVNGVAQLLVEEASHMIYGSEIHPHDSDNVELRVKVAKKLTMKRITSFVQEFGEIVGTMVD